MNWRNFLTEEKSQRLLSAAILMTLEKVANVCCDQQIILSEEKNIFLNHLHSSSDHDITQVFNLCRYQFERAQTRNMSLQYAMRLASQDRNSPKFKEYQFLNFRLRELMSLCELLKFARNVAVHDFSERTDAWSLCVASSFLRLTEIAVLPKTPVVESVIDELRQKLDDIIYVKNSENITNNIQEAPNNNDLILEKLTSIEQVLMKSSQSNELPSIQPIELEDEPDEPILEDNTEQLIQEMITQEQLRQELLKIRGFIQKEFSEHAKWTGLESNFLKSQTIEEIFDLRPKLVADLIRNEPTISEYNMRKEIFDLQIEKFQFSIDNLLERTVWE